MDGAVKKQSQLGDQVARATKLVSEGNYSELADLADEMERALAEGPVVSPRDARDLRSRLTVLTDVMGHVSAVHRALRQIGAPSDSSYSADGSLEPSSRGSLRGEA